MEFFFYHICENKLVNENQRFVKICSLTLKDELIGPDPSATERDVFLNENTGTGVELEVIWKYFCLLTAPLGAC